MRVFERYSGSLTVWDVAYEHYATALLAILSHGVLLVVTPSYPRGSSPSECFVRAVRIYATGLSRIELLPKASYVKRA